MSLEELKKRREQGFTKPRVEYNKPGPAVQAAEEIKQKGKEEKK